MSDSINASERSSFSVFLLKKTLSDTVPLFYYITLRRLWQGHFFKLAKNVERTAEDFFLFIRELPKNVITKYRIYHKKSLTKRQKNGII